MTFSLHSLHLASTLRTSTLLHAHTHLDTLIAFFRVQAVILSRFLVSLRRAAEPEPLPSHQSRVSMINFRMPTIAGIIGDMGEPLGDDQDESNADEEEGQGAIREVSPSISPLSGHTSDSDGPLLEDSRSGSANMNVSAKDPGSLKESSSCASRARREMIDNAHQALDQAGKRLHCVDYCVVDELTTNNYRSKFCDPGRRSSYLAFQKRNTCIC